MSDDERPELEPVEPPTPEQIKQWRDEFAIGFAVQRYRDLQWEFGSLARRHRWDPFAHGVARRVIDFIRSVPHYG